MSIFSWIGKLFKSVKNDADKVAIAITEGLQAALKAGVVGFLAKVVENVVPSVGNLPDAVVAQLSNLVPKALAAELALQGLPDNPSSQDILIFEQQVLTAFGLHDNKSKLYTTLAAQIYQVLQAHNGNTAFTFAELVADVEQCYQDYVADLAAESN